MTTPTPRTLRQSFRSVLRSGLVRTGLGAMALRVTGLALSLGMSVFLARVMGADGLGQYALAFAVLGLLGLPVQMGMSSLVLRETARANAVGDWPLLRGIWYWATRRILVVSGVIIVVAGLILLIAPDLIAPHSRTVLLIGMPLIPLIALSQMRSSALRGVGWFVPGQIPDTLLRPGLMMALGFAAYLWAGRQISAETVMTAHVISAGVAFAFGVLLLLRARPAGMLTATGRQIQARAWRAAIWPLALISGAQSITANTDFIMLGWWRQAAEIGHYKVAASAANVSVIVPGVLAMIAEPRVATLFRQGDMARLARLAAGVALAGFVLTMPAILVLIIWGGPVLNAVFGAGFEEGAAALSILLIGQVVNAFFGICISLLNMTGHERLAMRGLLAAALVNVALNLFLIPGYGIQGAAMATAFSTALWNVVLWYGVRRKLDIDSSPLGLLRLGGH